jgi:hypothetical protein
LGDKEIGFCGSDENNGEIAVVGGDLSFFED